MNCSYFTIIKALKSWFIRIVYSNRYNKNLLINAQLQQKEGNSYVEYDCLWCIITDKQKLGWSQANGFFPCEKSDRKHNVFLNKCGFSLQNVYFSISLYATGRSFMLHKAFQNWVFSLFRRVLSIHFHSA